MYEIEMKHKNIIVINENLNAVFIVKRNDKESIISLLEKNGYLFEEDTGTSLLFSKGGNIESVSTFEEFLGRYTVGESTIQYETILVE